MVNVHHRAIPEQILDEQAMQTFRHQWQVYAKAVEEDYFSHRAVREVLHCVLAELERPFRFLDLACGDARTTVAALRGTKVSRYHGIDLSAPALELARQAVAALECPAELEQADFVAALRSRQTRADVVWIGLSLHHLQTPDKQALMCDARATVGKQGLFLIYEPTCGEGECRAAYLDRFERTCRDAWTALAPDEWRTILEHVRAADLPESRSVWEELGRAAGFHDVRPLFTDPGGMMTLFCYWP
jgi:SAM-dependent methyltransferase